MKAASFDYIAARTLDEAFELSMREGAVLMAGSQSLGPMLNLRLVRPKLIVDISSIAELRTIKDHDGAWSIGACVTHSEIEDRFDGFLRFVAGGIACRTVRNKGTIGGSLAHADPAGDWPLALMALGARVSLRSRTATRVVPIDQFLQGPFSTQLRRGELITALEVPKLDSRSRWGYFKVCRKVGEFPEASAAIVMAPGSARVFIGALDRPPISCAAVARRAEKRDVVSDEDFARSLEQLNLGLPPGEIRMRAGALARAYEQANGSYEQANG